MTAFELGNILKEMYEKAPKGQQVTMIHLFGIKYASEIRNNGTTPKEILISASMPVSYQVEINKGISLSRYVVAK